MDQLLFQYCPKLAVISQDGKSVLLCKRQGEQDYDGTFTLIGGKMERTDSSIVEALGREKSEEVGADFKVKALPLYSIDVPFRKKDGNYMIIPHVLAQHVDGEITLSDEYSEFAWVEMDKLADFEPKIANIAWIVPRLTKLRPIVTDNDFVEI